ncbi:alpha-2-macroglobulin family protein [Oceaniglobus roseus]|uniref:alpha-2-macroglobulin family protein n=1 Tax=Oceaniglobus roseus TaxID=1737570 RepID=UPI000C7EC848|nr:alpha-2-macroglobulin family protein [Kandeliimicrobium roseum]
MLRVVLTLASLALAAPALADSPVPERRVTVTSDTDFFGGDLSAVFDTTYDVCRATCLADSSCTAFTFNTRSNACFPKTGVTDRQPYQGAMSAEVTDVPAEILSRAEGLAQTLDFLEPADLEAAKAEAVDLPLRHAMTGLTAVELLQSARAARSSGNTGGALRFTGQALGITDAADLWTEYARLLLAVEASSGDQQQTYRNRAVLAAINGYLRSGTVPAQVSALEVMADALERVGRGRASIPALRLAQSLSPRDDIAAALDAAIGKFGFRVTDNSVESDAAQPRICAQFNEDLVQAGVDYATYVQTDAAGLVVQAEGNQLCLDGVEHGQRYRVTMREGLPAASGEVLAKSVPLTLYVRDRAPAARFPGRGYILPAGGEVAVPVVTVNLDTVELKLSRVSDRNLIRAIQGDMFARPVPQYRQDQFDGEIAEEIWSGTGTVQRDLNRDVTTRLPVGEVAGALKPGIYVLQARVPGADPYDDPAAAQWFVVSDLGLTTFSGNDGLTAFVRGLGDAAAKPGVTLTLLSRANAVLGTAETDAEGRATFAPGLTRGTGGAAPALLLAEEGDDMAFLPLTDPEFDLSDRGVEGRAPAGPVDVFVTTDRGAYRAGETIVATALARDDAAQAIEGLPLTAILYRPDGQEYSRTLSQDEGAGGHVVRMPVGDDVARGTWRLSFFADTDAPASATAEVLVEDFLPGRIDATLSLPGGPVPATGGTPLTVEAKYLFGAPGAGLKVETDVQVAPADTLDAYPGFVFGRYDQPVDAQSRYLDTVQTDAAGKAVIELQLPEMTAPSRPMEVRARVRVAEGSGRPIERDITRPLALEGPAIGLKPAFDGVLPENGTAAFQVIAANADSPVQARWTVNRVETTYQWYTLYGNWEWEPVTRRTRVATGEVTLGTDPVTVSAPVTWGQYEIRVERLGSAYAAASISFDAGWYAADGALDTPDVLELSLDKAAYAPGDTAELRIVPRAAGTALVSVLSDRVISTRTVEVPEGESTIPVPVTEDWGAGAYVTATVLSPNGAGHAPARALGLAYAKVDPGAAQLSASFEVPDSAEPRQPFEVALKVEGAEPGDTAHAVISAVDLGILNLTAFDSPDPSAYYFGQRKLGVAIRDVYGRLIDGNTGNLGSLRSGGDGSAGMRMQSPPPTEKLVAFTSGPLTVGEDGMARTTFDLPAFNGTVRLMATVWSATGVGQAEKDVLVRDPVVVDATLPRFLAPGDQSRLLLEVTHATGPTGAAALRVGSAGVTLELGTLPASFTLTEGEKQTFSVPITAGEEGDYTIDISLTTPGGKTLERQLTLPVRANDPETQRTSRFTLAAGDTFTFDDDVFAGLMPGTGLATLTAGPLARFDSPGLLAALDRYPYGCTEQVTSTAMPLLYLSSVARAMGLGTKDQLDERIEQAVTRVLDNQAPGGSFGLWGPGSGDFWLDAYVTDFLSRARVQGIDVPDTAFREALDNLRNRVNYAPDFDDGGEDIAYALQVLAREGAAAIGDLRYYADVKADAFATPLALAQLGAALASYGDPSRADAMFARAGERLTRPEPEEAGRTWRADYGTRLRDSAAVLTLAVESGSTAIPRDALIDRVVPKTGEPERSTQEAVWSLLAAHALIGDARSDGLTVNGAAPDGPLIRVREADTAGGPVEIANTGSDEATLTLTTFGVPEVPEPKGGEGYAIERTYFTMEGDPVQPDRVKIGTRLVALLTVQPFADTEARLMVDDPLPAGFEIDNPNLLQSGDIAALDWLDTVQDVQTAQFLSDRFLAAVDWRSDQAFRVAYIVRAVSPGLYHHPAASVEDMYRPRFRAHTATGQVAVTE